MRIKGKMKLKRYQRYFRLVFLILLSVFFIFGGFGIYLTYKNISKQNYNVYFQQVKAYAHEIEMFLSDIRSDVKFLSDVPPIHGILRARLNAGYDAEGNTSYEDWKKMLEAIFAGIMLSEEKYMQLRYIDETGKEKVRVNFKDGHPVVVPEKELKNKASRYYFKKAMELSRGEIYVSPIDLNRERGKIEVPYNPTIRYAIPVFGQQGERRGIIIANVLVDKMLFSIRKFKVKKGINIFSVGRDGYYLCNSDHRDWKWGGPQDLNTGWNLKNDYVSCSKELLTQSSGQIYSKKNKEYLFFKRVQIHPDMNLFLVLAIGVDRWLYLFPLYVDVGLTIAVFLFIFAIVFLLSKYVEKQMEEYEKIKDSLTHMIIHDLNNPLMAISGRLQLLKMDEENFNEEQKESLNAALLASKDLKIMIGSLLDISKMEEGKLKIRAEDFQLKDLVVDVVGEMDIIAQKEEKSVSVDTSQDMPNISADKELVRRVIFNLISNAIKHSPSKGVILVKVFFKQEDQNFYIQVKDPGEGIPKEYLDKIFDKFVQVEDNKAKMGRGLGLTFCKMAVEAHGGKIWVKSELGKGSTFYLTIPLKGQD